MTQDDIIAAARACLGTPFRHQGRIPGSALDCAGLVVAVAEAIGADYIDQVGYGRVPSENRLALALEGQPCLARVASCLPGDVLLLSFGGEPQHLAISAGPTLIHAWEAVGRVCEHDLDARWRSRVVQIYRFEGLA